MIQFRSKDFSCTKRKKEQDAFKDEWLGLKRQMVGQYKMRGQENKGMVK